MKKILTRTYINIVVALAGICSACEQETYEPNFTVAPGGGTVTTYKSYTLDASNPGGDNIYGRIVFYKYTSRVTLVQIGLYNTDDASTYSAMIYAGKASGVSTMLEQLDEVNGATGGFITYKYFTITKENFFEELSGYDANVKVMLSAAVVASGDIGANADPVVESD